MADDNMDLKPVVLSENTARQLQTAFNPKSMELMKSAMQVVKDVKQKDLQSLRANWGLLFENVQTEQDILAILDVFGSYMPGFWEQASRIVQNKNKAARISDWLARTVASLAGTQHSATFVETMWDLQQRDGSKYLDAFDFGFTPGSPSFADGNSHIEAYSVGNFYVGPRLLQLFLQVRTQSLTAQYSPSTDKFDTSTKTLPYSGSIGDIGDSLVLAAQIDCRAAQTLSGSSSMKIQTDYGGEISWDKNDINKINSIWLLPTTNLEAVQQSYLSEISKTTFTETASATSFYEIYAWASGVSAFSIVEAQNMICNITFFTTRNQAFAIPYMDATAKGPEAVKSFLREWSNKKEKGFSIQGGNASILGAL